MNAGVRACAYCCVIEMFGDAYHHVRSAEEVKGGICEDPWRSCDGLCGMCE
jgi:hypothetical protein